MTTSSLLVSDFMKPVTDFFSPDTSVEEVVDTLVKSHMFGAPVLDEHKKLVGFISEKDCLKQMVNNSYYSEHHHTAKDIMRLNPLSVTPNTDIINLADEMLGQRPKLYPVVENDQVIGIITRSDVLRALSTSRQH